MGGAVLALILISGPTATGKTELGICLAQKLDSVIINGDSRQVYQELDIGTAKPTPSQRAQVPHYLTNWVAPTELITVAQYQSAAQRLIDQFQGQGKIPLLVGGSGLYLQAVVQGLRIPPVAPQPKLRQQLSTYSQLERYHFLQQIDPPSARKIHPHDAVRTLRALEVYYVMGRSLSQLQGQNIPNYPVLYLYLDSDQLTLRISQRTQKMIDQGLVAETQLLQAKYGADLPLLKTLGYQEISDYLRGNCTLIQAQEAIIQHTRQLAKRQRTWFRGQSGLVSINSDRPDLITYSWDKVQAFLTAIRY
ncbi:tRNA isopentenyltransferase [Gloeomargarita lithophora Alchichica-D10]|uniref:tRNA dimethylallyltransferase n=1 Tax=Gloeomargarita lithophora Alchichica-D10 TaxID=1188229 RepID=A0A1J0AG96_9CYAN|nr:tRNA (adenosine(37)-N6)-dimethylallyltransferase MiaA [Gloeomargarita lithophora]APB34935.1 tRNA isopentenyltransferase [Gloeomargarita lithophora Alchichica-D10]